MPPDTAPFRVVEVAVAVIRHPDGRVLLADRPADKIHAGYWEFPGGKIDAGETAAEALARELDEELGITPIAVDPWITRTFAYPDLVVRLHCHRVTAWRGDPSGREGQRLAWEDPSSPRLAPLLPANHAIMQALALPPVYAITAAARYGEAGFLARLDAALARGIRLIQVREPEFDPPRLARFAQAVIARARPCGARILINSDAALARDIGADGVHLPARKLMTATAPPAGLSLWSASCHDASELARAAELGASFAVLSPVLPTPTHPEASGIGWAGFAALVRDCPLPVFALGGMQQALLPTACRHGAHGIALLSGAWPTSPA